MDNYGVIEMGNAMMSIPGAVLWVIFAFFFFAVADKAETKTGSIVVFTVMLGAFTVFLMNMGWFFVVGN